MKQEIPADLKSLVIAKPGSHKGQNGRLMVIGGSRLFHAASIWALEVASRIVDLVHYSSVSENNEIVMSMKKQFRNGIVVPRGDIENYIQEDDCALIGPGMVRTSKPIQDGEARVSSIHEIDAIKDEGVQTAALTYYLLEKYPHKQWIIDAGALQMLDLATIPKNSILTPHHGEFRLLCERAQISDLKSKATDDVDKVKLFAKTYQCTVLLKGERDIVSSGEDYRVIEGGNEGMTKGGTGDVLAGLVAALACKNDPMQSAVSGSYINKISGERLYKTVGPFFNASDLAAQIPKTMKELFSNA